MQIEVIDACHCVMTSRPVRHPMGLLNAVRVNDELMPPSAHRVTWQSAKALMNRAQAAMKRRAIARGESMLIVNFLSIGSGPVLGWVHGRGDGRPAPGSCSGSGSDADRSSKFLSPLSYLEQVTSSLQKFYM